MAKIIKLPVSFEAQRRAKIQKIEALQSLAYARAILEHQLFKLSLMRHFPTPF